ncbi:MAG: ATP-binding protein [Dehalococcoidia bacterium]
MESLGDILKRLRQQSISAAESLPPSWANAIDQATDEPDCVICGGRGWVRRDVPTTHLDFGKAFPCVCQREASQEERVSRLQRFSNMGVLAQATFELIDQSGPGASAESQGRYHAAVEAARGFTAQPSGAFVLMGGSGTGKTYLAAAIANALMGRDEPVFFAFVPDLLDHLRATYNPDSELSYDELFDLVKTIPVLVLDDLSINSSAWAEEKLYQVLNHRQLSSLPTIVTCNAPLERLDARLQSRLLDPRMSRVIDLGGSVQSAVPGIGAIEPELLKHMTFALFDPNGHARDREERGTLQAALAMAQAFAQDPEGWLVLVGDSGCGKTHLAIATANARLQTGGEVFFAFVPDLLDHLRYTFSPDSRVTYDVLFDQVKQAPLLVLDDLGAESATPWANEKLYQIVVHRHNARLPTIITTRAIPSGANDPVASRLNDPRLVTVQPITAPDYRQSGGRAPQRAPRSRGR